MSWTKRQLVVAALEEIGLAAYVFDSGPEQIESAVRRLDAMMSQWTLKGIRLGYPLSSSPENTNLDAETSVPSSASQAIITNLAVMIAPSYGKVVTPETRMTAREAYLALLSVAAMPAEMQMPGMMPAGAGYKSWQRDQVFLDPPEEGLALGGDSELDFP